MSDSNWRRVAVFGVVLLTAGAIAFAFSSVDAYRRENRDNYKKDAARNAAETRHVAIVKCGKFSGAALTLCLDNAVSANAEISEPDYDLKAQQEMAEWAFAMWWTALFGSVVTTVGVFYVARTLHQTREATKAAIAGAKAADDAVKVTREIGQAQARAYLAIEGVSISLAKDSNANTIIVEPNGAPIAEGDVCPTFYFQVRNYGQSPAHNFRWKPSIKLMAFFVSPEGARYVERQGPKNFPLTADAAAWGETIQASDKPISFKAQYLFAVNDVEIRAAHLKSGDGGLNVTFVISYQANDVFGELISGDVAFSITCHEGKLGGSPSGSLPVEVFETQPQVEARAKAAQAGSIAMIQRTDEKKD